MLFYVLTAVLAYVLGRALWRRWRYDVHKIPSPPALPFFGHTIEILNGNTTRMNKWTSEHLKKLGYPKIMKVDLFHKTWLFISDADVVKNVVMDKKEPFPRYLDDGAFILPMIGNDKTVKTLALTEMPSPYVRTVRRVYAMGLQTSNLREIIPALSHVMEKLIALIEKKRKEGPVDVQELFVRLTLDVIGEVAYGENLGGLDGSRDLHDLLLDVGYIARENFINPLQKLYCTVFPGSDLAKHQNRKVNRLSAEWMRLAKSIRDREDPADGEEPMWYGFKMLTDPETKELLSLSALANELGVVVLGGMDTTAHQLTWTFALLANHPEIVEKILEELTLKGLAGPGSREPTYDDIGELAYLTAVVKESMRISYVSAGSFSRYVPRDMEILGYRVPKGAIVVLPGTGAILRESEWGDPEVFRPERWLESDLSNSYSLAFGIGPRDCIGQRLAMLEMRLAIVRLLTRYNISSDEKWIDLRNNAKEGLVLEVRDGMNLMLTPRIFK